MLRKAVIILPKHNFDLLNIFLLISSLIFVFCGSLSLVSLTEVFFLLSCVCGLIWVILRGRIYIDAAFILTILFSVSYLVCDGIHNGVTAFGILFQVIFFPALYQIGRALGDYEQGFDVLWGTAIAIALGYFLQSYLLVVNSVRWEGIDLSYGSFYLFWNDNIAPRTCLTVYQISLVGMFLPILITKNSYRKWYTVLFGILAILFCIWSQATAGNRAFFVVLLIVAVIWAIMLLFKFKTLKSRIIYCSVVVLAVAFGIISLMGYGPLGEWLMSIPVIRRFISGGSNASRLRLYHIFFQNFIYYPFGGLNLILDDHFVHNLILDFYAFGGVIPFICAVIFFVRSFYLFVWLKKTDRFADIRYVCIVLTVFMIYCFGLLDVFFQTNVALSLIPFLLYSYVEGIHDQSGKITTLKYNI